MKKVFKSLLAGTTAAIMTVLPGLSIGPAFAFGWQQDSSGWKYCVNEDNTNWYVNSWQWIDGNNDGVAECYYFTPMGYMYANTTTPDGYTVNADGAWVQNGVVQTKTVEKSQVSETSNDLKLTDVSYTSIYAWDSNVTQSTFNQFANEIIYFMNQDRNDAGVNSLIVDNHLMDYAMTRAKELSKLYAHKHPDGSSLSTKYGENIQFAYNTHSSKDAEVSWMNSAGHRKNILNASYTNVGVGVYAADGKIFCVQVFENKNHSSSSSSKSSSSYKSSAVDISSMSDEEFQAWAQKVSGDTDEFVEKNNVRYHRAGDAEYESFIVD